jgi:hypothetical protein
VLEYNMPRFNVANGDEESRVSSRNVASIELRRRTGSEASRVALATALSLRILMQAAAVPAPDARCARKLRSGSKRRDCSAT